MRYVPQKFQALYATAHEPESQRILMSWYWHGLLVLCGIIMTAGLALGVYEYLQPLSVAEEMRRPKQYFTRAELQALLADFDERSQKFNERRVRPLPLKDPSQ